MEGTSGDSAASTRSSFIDRLAASDEARKAAAAKRKEESAELADPREDVSAFLGSFRTELEQLAQKIQGLGLSKEVSQQSIEPNPQSGQMLDSVSTQLFQMEKRLAECSYFLPLYDLRQTSASIAELKQQTEDAKVALLPKRKFAFSKKAFKPKAAEDEGSSDGPTTATHVAPSGPSMPDSAVQVSERSDTASVPAEPSYRGPHPTPARVIVKTAEEISSGDVVLEDLEQCSIWLLGDMQALRLRRLRHCRVYGGPVRGATFVDDVQGCVVQLASYQVRIHRAHHTDFCLRSRSNPIIEHSTGLRFSPLALLDSPSFVDWLAAAQLGEDAGQWSKVDDFGWIKATHSPNWSVLPEEQQWPAPQPPTLGSSDVLPGS